MVEREFFFRGRESFFRGGERERERNYVGVRRRKDKEKEKSSPRGATLACCREFSPQRRNKGNFFENDLSRGGGPHLANVPSVAPPRRTVAMAKGDTSQLRRGSVPRGRKGAWQEGSTTPPTTSALSPRPSSSLPSRRTRRRRRQTRRIRWRCARWILRRDAQRQTRGLRKCSSLRGSRGGSDGRLEFLFRFFGRIFYGENERAGRKSAKFATYFFFPGDSDPPS